MQVMYYVFILGLAEYLESRVLKSGPQTNAPGNTPRSKARKTAGAGGGGCGANRALPKTRGVFIIKSKAIFKKSYQAFNKM